MPLTLFGPDGLPRETVHDPGPGARARIQHRAAPGEVLAICTCRTMHLTRQDANDCPGLIMTVRFGSHGPAILPGPAFAG